MPLKTKSTLKPCLVIGSGFHRWVVGDIETPLSSWHKLIEAVALEMHVSAPSKNYPPTFRWEKLLENAGRDGFMVNATGARWVAPNHYQPSQVEDFAKKAVARVLEQQAQTYPRLSGRAQLPFDDALGAVVSLNFDHCWFNPNDRCLGPGRLGGAKKKDSVLTKNEYDRLAGYVETNDPRFVRTWFPNGHIKNSDAIRMGLSDYGAQPHAIKQAFGWIKAGEPTADEANKKSVWVDYFERLANQFSKPIDKQESRLQNWVAHFLYRPLYFAGVGLSDHETGMWWLLAQRARNLARIAKQQRPKTVILISANDPRRFFWSMRPFGIEALVCDDWDQGWEQLRERWSGLA